MHYTWLIRITSKEAINNKSYQLLALSPPGIQVVQVSQWSPATATIHVHPSRLRGLLEPKYVHIALIHCRWQSIKKSQIWTKKYLQLLIVSYYSSYIRRLTGLPFLRHRAGDYRHFILITGLQALVTILPVIT